MIIPDEEKYKHNRNEFRFNACFIVPAQANALKYEVAVRKLAKYLRTLEVSLCPVCLFFLKEKSMFRRIHVF